MTKLCARDLSQFAAALHEQRRFRVQQLAELAPAEGGAGETFGSAEVSEALRTGAAHALREIEAALSRLADGSYGTCTECGRAVTRERLEVLPAAALCMACQHRVEAARMLVGIGDPARRR
jgi:RNA polymerase-binding transcription factor DksA